MRAKSLLTLVLGSMIVLLLAVAGRPPKAA